MAICVSCVNLHSKQAKLICSLSTQASASWVGCAGTINSRANFMRGRIVWVTSRTRGLIPGRGEESRPGPKHPSTPSTGATSPEDPCVSAGQVWCRDQGAAVDTWDPVKLAGWQLESRPSTVDSPPRVRARANPKYSIGLPVSPPHHVSSLSTSNPATPSLLVLVKPAP